MPITTARDLITASMRTAGIIGEIATPTAEQTLTGLDELNAILEEWSNESLIPYKKELVSFTTSAGQADYTIGQTSAADVSASVPTNIESVSLIQDGTTIYPLNFVSFIDFNENRRDLSTSTLPTIYTYNRTYPEGTISLYAIPDTAYTVRMIYATAMGGYGLNDDMDLPTGYTSALQYELASMLLIVYGISNPAIAQIAARRKANLERNNLQGNRLSFNTRRKYDIHGDRYV